MATNLLVNLQNVLDNIRIPQLFGWVDVLFYIGSEETDSKEFVAIQLNTEIQWRNELTDVSANEDGDVATSVPESIEGEP